MFDNLIDKVRIEGCIQLDESPFLRDILPIVYKGEANPSAPRAVRYQNSGGRAIIFERGDLVYRIKGVDPFGELTKRVAASEKNKTSDVNEAHALAQSQFRDNQRKPLLFTNGKPFGTLFREQAESERDAFEILAKIYSNLGIPNPCEFICYQDTGIEVDGKRTYQTAFKLPSIGADLRVNEWDSLLTERLDQCTPNEINAKRTAINRLYGRFVYWAGVNVAALSCAGLSPTALSFVPQNWVISKYEEGYGIFRVDHTSTRKVDPKTAMEKLMEKEHDLPHIVNNFSVFPGRVQVAANPKAFLHAGRANAKFSEILLMQREIKADESKIIGTHKEVFSLGLTSILERNKPMPISEELFREALS